MKGKMWTRLRWTAVLLLMGVVAWAGEKNPLADILAATPWCSFTYNEVTGSTSTTRYQFFRDGRYAAGTRSEGHSSGDAGRLTSRRDRSSLGMWRLEGDTLYVTVNGVTREPAHLSVKTNNDGAPVVIADGVEFNPCE